MNKTELRDAVAAAADLNGTQADKAVNAVLDSIASALAAGDKVTLPGFGTFETRDRAARQGRPPDGRDHGIAASTSVGFQAGRTAEAEGRQELTCSGPGRADGAGAPSRLLRPAGRRQKAEPRRR